MQAVCHFENRTRGSWLLAQIVSFWRFPKQGTAISHFANWQFFMLLASNQPLRDHWARTWFKPENLVETRVTTTEDYDDALDAIRKGRSRPPNRGRVTDSPRFNQGLMLLPRP
jgi:hypothetical protein